MAESELNRRVRTLRQALSFAHLDEDTLRELAEMAETRSFTAGDLVFEKGSSPDGLYVVISGTVGIFDVIHGRRTDIAAIGPGDFFGEISLALHTLRTRAAEAREATELMVLPIQSLQEVLSAKPSLAAQLVEAFGDREAGREDAAN